MNFSDEELMVMFAAGTAEAFDMLYDRYKNRIYGFALTCLRSPQDAEDAVQDIFLRVARSALKYTPENKFKPWIFKITVNRIRTISSRESRQKEKIQQAKTLLFHSSHINHVSDQISRELVAWDQLEKLLVELPSDMRVMLLLKELEGMSIRTIADTMGISPENVRVRIHRARKKLRECLRAETQGGCL